MKERCKTAARSRREKENAEFEQLAKLLPLPANITSHLDKASVIRLTTSYLKMRKLFPSGLGEEWGAELESPHSSNILRELSSHLLFSLDGFVFMLDQYGKVIYVSETASVHLGLSQIEMTGNSIYDFIHLADYDEMRSMLNREFPSQHKCSYESLEIPLNFCLRMKCVLAKRNAGLAMDGYKVIHYTGYLKLKKASDALTDSQVENGEVQKTDQQYHVAGLVAIGQSLPSSSITDIKMSSHTFMFRAGLDLTLIYVDARNTAFSGFEPLKLLGKTLYQFVHCSDCMQLQMDHRSLLIKGQVITKYYRLLTRNGGWIWIQSYCTMIHNNRASKLNCIVALNHVISGPGCSEQIVDAEQLLYEDLHCNNGKITKSIPCSKRPQKIHPQAKPEGLLLNDSANCFLNCSNNMSGGTDIFTSHQSSSPIRENEGSSDVPKIIKSMCKVSSKRKSPPVLAFKDISDTSKAQKTKIPYITLGKHDKNDQFMNKHIVKLNQHALNNITNSSENNNLEQNFSMVNNYPKAKNDKTPYMTLVQHNENNPLMNKSTAKLNQHALNNITNSSESSSSEQNFSMVNNYPKTIDDSITYTKSSTDTMQSIPGSGTMDTSNFIADNNDLKGFSDNSRELFPAEIHNSEIFCDFKSPVSRAQTVLEKIQKCDNNKLLNSQPIQSPEMTNAVCFTKKNENTKKNVRKLKVENKNNSNNLKRNSASSSICLKLQSNSSHDSSQEENSNFNFTNVLPITNNLPESKVSCVGEYSTASSHIQDKYVSTTNFKHNGIMINSAIPSPCCSGISDLPGNPTVTNDCYPGMMVHSTCYEMLRAASNNVFGINSDSASILLNRRNFNPGDSSDLNAKFVLSDNCGYNSPSFSPINSEDVNFCDQLYSNCSDSRTQYFTHDRTLSSSEISSSNVPFYLEYESFSAASTPLSNDVSTDNSSIATTSIDSDYQVFGYDQQSALDLNTKPLEENGTDVSETELIPFDKAVSIFTDIDNQSNGFPFDGAPFSDHMFNNLAALISDVESESFPEVDCNWLSSPCVVGNDLSVLRRSFSGTLHGQTD